MPRNVANERFTSTSVCGCKLPMVEPILSRGTVCVLSIMIWDFLRNPLSAVGSIWIRSRGAARRSLVIGNTVTDPSASNKSD